MNSEYEMIAIFTNISYMKLILYIKKKKKHGL